MTYQTRPNPKADHAAVAVIVHCAADIKPTPINWRWRYYLPESALTLLAGDPSAGKSTIAYSTAATISKGGEWPDGTRAEVGKVLIWSGEDDKSATIIPRLVAMGADLNNIFIISTVNDSQGKKRAFDPATDIEGLSQYVSAHPGICLLIVDPLVSVIGDKDSHKNAEVRSGLQTLVDFGEKHNLAMIGIHHLTKGTSGKNPLDRVTGSLAFGAVARMVWMAAKQQPGEIPPRIFVRAKSNIGPEGGGFGYDTALRTPFHDEPAIEAVAIKWLDPLDGTARELLAEAEEVKERDKPATTKAKAFLEDFLTDGPRDSREVFAVGKDEGHSAITLKRIKGVRKERQASGVCLWSLPPGGFPL